MQRRRLPHSRPPPIAACDRLQTNEPTHQRNIPTNTINQPTDKPYCNTSRKRYQPRLGRYKMSIKVSYLPKNFYTSPKQISGNAPYQQFVGRRGPPSLHITSESESSSVEYYCTTAAVCSLEARCLSTESRAQYTPPTRRNCRVSSRRRCVHEFATSSRRLPTDSVM